MIAKKAAKLVVILQAMEATTEAIAVFWTMESDIFITQGQKMETDEIHFNKILLEKAVSKEDIATWAKAKSDFEIYVKVMTIVLNLFNFATDAKPVPTHEFVLDKLDLKLSVPSTINIKNIMKGSQ